MSEDEALIKKMEESAEVLTHLIETTIKDAKDDVTSIVKDAKAAVKSTDEDTKKATDVGKATKMVKRIIS